MALLSPLPSASLWNHFRGHRGLNTTVYNVFFSSCTINPCARLPFSFCLRFTAPCANDTSLFRDVFSGALFTGAATITHHNLNLVIFQDIHTAHFYQVHRLCFLFLPGKFWESSEFVHCNVHFIPHYLDL